MALRIGLHAWTAFKPGMADPDKCKPEEHMVECEFRLHNPSVVLIRLGTNDTAEGNAYERAIRYAIEYSIKNGVIPVLVTKSIASKGIIATTKRCAPWPESYLCHCGISMW